MHAEKAFNIELDSYKALFCASGSMDLVAQSGDFFVGVGVLSTMWEWDQVFLIGSLPPRSDQQVWFLT